MNIQKAIEIKRQYQYKLQDAFMPELIEADNISIEALKREVYNRENQPNLIFGLLPGETEAK